MTEIDKIPLGLAILASALAVLGAGLQFIGWWGKREARLMLDEFQRRFPGRCPICSYHDYGVREGHVSPGPAPAHHCLEKKA